MRILVVIIAVGVMVSVIFASGTQPSWEYNKTVDGIKYSRIRFEEIEGKGIVSIGLLAATTEVAGRTYTGWFHRRVDGTILGGMLAEEAEYKDMTIPDNTWVSFDRDDHLIACHFPGDRKIQGYLCRCTGGVKGSVVNFYPSGKLRTFFSPDAVVIKDVSCKGGLFHSIGLHEDGSLRMCTLKETTRIGEQEFKVGTRVVISADGKAEPLP